MPSGGARTRSGPPPDPAALRRDRKTDGEWTLLPAKRPGRAPAWPLVGRSDREAELWSVFWRKPQAVQWERLGQEFEVALYVRNLAIYELPGAPVNLGTLVRQQADALGLTIPGLRAHRWRIATDQVAEKREQRAAPTRPLARDRLRVAGGDAR